MARVAGGHVELIADRFAADDRGRTFDLATGKRVCMILSSAGGPAEQVAWAERCAWFATFMHPSIAPLIDYGSLGETQRFETWRAEPGWRGAPGAAEQAVCCANRVLTANGRARLHGASVHLGCRAGRPVVVPDLQAGLIDRPAREGDDGGRQALGIMCPPDRRLGPIIDLLGGPSVGRVAALAVWAPEGGGVDGAVRMLARAARIAGRVPVSTTLLGGQMRKLVLGRTLLIIARDDAVAGWRGLLEASLDASRAHVVLFAGAQPVRRVHTVPLERQSLESLVASVCPEPAARRHLRHVTSAARRSEGLRGRFAQLLFAGLFAAGDAPEPGVELRVADDDGPSMTSRVAESGTLYRAELDTRSADGGVQPFREWPAPGELARLRGQLEAGRSLLACGRRQPGERAARQTMHAFARRGEWVLATESALLVAASLVARGRMADADVVLDTARPWATDSHDLQLLHEIAVLRAGTLVERGRLSDAESLLETMHPSAMSTRSDTTVDVTLALARCLFWQGRWVDAWQRLAFVQLDAERSRGAEVRLRTVRSLISTGRGRAADAVGDAAQARDTALTVGDPRLCAGAFFACAVAQLGAGDGTQADAAAVSALEQARRAHDPMLALEARLLRAEIARRLGNRGPAVLLVKRLGSLRGTTLPFTVRARVDLLRELLTSADPAETADRRADASGLHALRLFAPQRPPSSASLSPATDDIVELLRCCQSADEDRAVLISVCARLRSRLSASGVGFYATEGGELVAVAADGARPDPASARRIATANQLVLPHSGGERVEAGAPVRYAGQVLGFLVAAWPPASVWHSTDLSVLLTTGATAAGPALSGLLARRTSERQSRASDLLGVSRAVAEVRAAVERAAAAPFPVLVQGESGSGKELVARLLHRLGPRADRPFSTLNCAALPEDLVESELFGHARGAFTGAVGERRGVFEDAHTGTLFLDEIGELSPRAQAKLLRAVQEGEIRRVGENLHRRVDVRLVTATNRDLRAEAATGRFRADLLYRLDVIRLALPPLRERSDDVPVLAEHFWREATTRIGSRATLSAATLSALARYGWPGNIRELQNVLASLAVRCPKRGVISPSALPPQFGERDLSQSFKLESARRTFDRAFIRAALVRAGGHRTRAAEELGVSRQGLAKLLARLEIEDDETYRNENSEVRN